MKRWYRIRLVKNPQGPRRRIMPMGGAQLRFSTFQDDPEAEDYPEKVLLLEEEEAERFARNADLDVRHAATPKPTLLSENLRDRMRTNP